MSAMPVAQPERLPELMSAQDLERELGVRPATAERIMRSLAQTRIGRRRFVQREDVRAFIAANTVGP